MRYQKNKKKLQFIILFFILGNTFFGQNGNLFITNYSPYKLGGSSDQNHDIIEDNSQRIFVANLNGVYYGDGKKWELIKLRNEASSYSLSKSKDGRIYVGGEAEFGYIEKLRDGRFEYISLASRLKSQELDFSTVWYTYTIENAVVFLSNERLFKYENGKLISYLPKGSRFHTAFPVGEHLLIRDDGVGLKVLINDSLYLIDGTETFAEARIYSILHDKGNEYFIFSRDAGIFKFIYNPKRPRSSLITKINSDFENWMLSGHAEISCGLKLSENHFAFGSLMNGVVITDENFNIVKRINSSTGLQDDMVKRLYRDNGGNIWVSLNKGASLVEYNSPISYWNFDEGINGVVESVVKVEGVLYIGTDKGLKYLNEEKEVFEDLPFDGITPWALLNINEKLFVAGEDGVYLHNKTKFEKIYSSESVCYAMQIDRNNPGLILVGNERDLVIIRNQVNSYFVHHVIKDLGNIRKIISTKSGIIVAATNDNGLFLIDKHRNYKVIPIGTKEGLPTLLENEIFRIGEEVFVNSDKSSFLKIEYINGKLNLKSSYKLNSLLKNSAVEKAQQINQQIWIETLLDKKGTKSEEIAILKIKGDSLIRISSPLKRIREVNVKQFYHDSDKVFLATNNGLYAYDLKNNDINSPIKTYITFFGSKHDSLGIYNNLEQEFKTDNIKISYADNSILIKPGTSVYYGSENIEFSYYLEGRETNFSDWKDVNEINYDNLDNGSYIFHLRARNVLGTIGDEVVLKFTILPPWYRTWWAYVIYSVLVILIIYTIVKLNTKRLVEANVRLEKIIHARTKTIVDQKAEIEHKNQEITDSINYAKRIQLSILPSIDEIHKNWKDVGIFYQPKDIVSGDFYWYHKVSDSQFLIACADCTGHGVPGGFMSMICSDKLHQAAEKSVVPAEILYMTNNFVKDSLKQGNIEGGTKDGMEVAVLLVDTKFRKVSYAGANRLLWIIRNGKEEIEEIKPNKASIASFTEDNYQYTNHEFQFSEGDLLYLTSDGFPDQFGGPDGKKYMSKNLKRFILEIKNHTIEKQTEMLRNEINNWMKGYEQVDDLLVINVKL